MRIIGLKHQEAHLSLLSNNMPINGRVKKTTMLYVA